MNTFPFSPISNPFTRPTFWGREKELGIIAGRLLSDPPQSIPIIGEPFIGKSTLVRHLMGLSFAAGEERQTHRTFVFLDCQPYIRLKVDMPEKGDYASARFWWNVYKAVSKSLPAHESFPEPRRNDDPAALQDQAFDIRMATQRAIENHDPKVIFIFDNFEGIAYLPFHNSDWLRSIAASTGSAFIVTSQYALYILYNYHAASMMYPSPLWNMFSDPIYLGLMPEQEVEAYLFQAARLAREAGSHWLPRDTAFIRSIAGRHPELLRIACARLFEARLSPSSATDQENDFLTLRVAQDANPVCKQLWQGLANPELEDQPGLAGAAPRRDSSSLSIYQEALRDIAQGRPSVNARILFTLEQRGLIERAGGEWRVFAGVMRQFVLAQEIVEEQNVPALTIHAARTEPEMLAERNGDKPLTYKEGKVYDYLKTHLDNVCDRTEIKQAVWGENNMPSNSALQKIIERIRQKIKDDPDTPYRLIAVRGRGYMLRKVL